MLENTIFYSYIFLNTVFVKYLYICIVNDGTIGGTVIATPGSRVSQSHLKKRITSVNPQTLI